MERCHTFRDRKRGGLVVVGGRPAWLEVRSPHCYMQGTLLDWVRIADRPAEVAASVTDFLRGLEGPTLIRIPGRDSGRNRFMATLLHGNESSGVRALHRWLREGREPAVDVAAFVGNVEAALGPPEFFYRMAPGQRDWNRVFRPPFAGHEGQTAAMLLELITAMKPEAVVDIHNNSGNNPAYGVVTSTDRRYLNLVSLFAPRCVVTRLNLGTLTEATDTLPSVTIEAGRSGDPTADEAAYQGLCRYFESSQLQLDQPPPDFEIYHEPLRVLLHPDVRVAFASVPVSEADLTLYPTVDNHNFVRTPAGTSLGWFSRSDAWPFVARDAEGRDRSRDCFEIAEGVVKTRVDMIPIMMTTSADIAQSDCLCYVVSAAPAGEA